MAENDGIHCSLDDNPEGFTPLLEVQEDREAYSLKTLQKTLTGIANEDDTSIMSPDSKVIVSYSLPDNITLRNVLMSGSLEIDPRNEDYVNLRITGVLPDTAFDEPQEEILKTSITMGELLNHLVSSTHNKSKEQLHVSYLLNFPKYGDSRHVGVVNGLSYLRTNSGDSHDENSGVFILDIRLQHVPYMS